MKKNVSKEKIKANIVSMEQISDQLSKLESKHHDAHTEYMTEFKRIFDIEKMAMSQIAISINKLNDKVNALTNELDEKNAELRTYREGTNFRIQKATFLELIKLYQFTKQDQNQNYIDIINEIFSLNEIFQIDAYEGMKFDPKKHFIKGIQKALNESEDDTIYKVNSEGYYVSDSPQSIKVLKYAEVILNKWEGK